MCPSLLDTRSVTTEIRRQKKKEERKKISPGWRLTVDFR